MEFKPANHSHWCPRCEAHKYCPQVTHCKRPDVSVCMDCQPEKQTLTKQIKGKSK
jgi:hypothetical protein